MKKIHVVRKDEESIEGYEKVEITPEGINMTAISQNECSLILASDIVDAVPTHDVPNALGLFASKLRIGGSLVTGGFDINLISRAIVRGDLDTQSASEMVCSQSSCLDMDTVKNILKSLQLKIKSTTYEGFKYEIEATR